MPDMDHPESFEQVPTGLPPVSPDMSVFWKPLRLLLQNGNPIDPVTILYYTMGDNRRLPFAAITKTRRNLLILWPPCDALEPGEFMDGHTFPIHHATLELSTSQTHFTRFEANGQRVHENPGWKLACFEDGIQLWLIGAFRVALLERQVGTLSQDVRMPKSDSVRRVDEFKRYGAQMAHLAENTPPLRGDCFVTAIHLLRDSASFRGPVKPTHFPMGNFWNDWIDGWPDGDNFQIAPTLNQHRWSEPACAHGLAAWTYEKRMHPRRRQVPI